MSTLAGALRVTAARDVSWGCPREATHERLLAAAFAAALALRRADQLRSSSGSGFKRARYALPLPLDPSGEIETGCTKIWDSYGTGSMLLRKTRARARRR